jgi:xanthine dehydrogenase molybdopterin-binding subunit B
MTYFSKIVIAYRNMSGGFGGRATCSSLFLKNQNTYFKVLKKSETKF